jgi:hypothetical protein
LCDDNRLFWDFSKTFSIFFRAEASNASSKRLLSSLFSFKGRLELGNGLSEFLVGLVRLDEEGVEAGLEATLEIINGNPLGLK